MKIENKNIEVSFFEKILVQMKQVIVNFNYNKLSFCWWLLEKILPHFYFFQISGKYSLKVKRKKQTSRKVGIRLKFSCNVLKTITRLLLRVF